MYKKIISLIMAVAMTATITTSFSAAGNAEETETFRLADNMFETTVVNQNRDGTSTYSLNNNETISVNLTLNNSSQEIESFSITDTNGQSLSSQLSDTNNSVEINGLELDELYVFESEVDGKSLRGCIEALQDGENIIAVTDLYDFSSLEAIYNSSHSMRSSGSTDLVYEANDTGSSSVPYYTLSNDDILKGTVHSSGDIDYYRFTVVNSGIVDFKLLVPNNSSLDLKLTISTCTPGVETPQVVKESSHSGTTDEICRIGVATVGTIYEVKITTISGSSGDYYLQIDNTPAKAWFPQSKGEISSTYYWNTNKLDRLYYVDSNNTYIQFTDNESSGNDAMASGCALASASMIFANMGTVSINYMSDFRLCRNEALYGMQYYEAQLNPDPFTVFLANNNLLGNEINFSYSDSNNNGYIDALEYTYGITGSGYSIGAINWSSTIAGKFGKNVRKYSDFSKTEQSFKQKLEEAYTTYSNSKNTGVLVYMEATENKAGVTGNYKHFIVVTKESGYYKVYDAGQASSTYAGKDLDLYLNQHSTYGYDDIVWFRVFY